MYRSIAAISALLIAVSPALSQSSSKAGQLIRNQVQGGVDVQSVQKKVFNDFFRIAPTGTLTRETAETMVKRNEAKKRQERLSKILRNDLNGDGEVSASESNRVRAVLVGHERVAFEHIVLDVDTDQDGTLSAAEIAAQIERELAETRESLGRHGLGGAAFLEFDVDGNGVVDIEEVQVSILRIAEEALQTREPQQSNSSATPALRNLTSGCELPEPSTQAQIIYIGSYRGTAVSSVAVAGMDEDTSFGTLNIEKGNAPLYILAALNDSAVLHVTGATDRIEQFVVSGYREMGVVGLPADVVKFTSLQECKIPVTYKSDSSKWIQARALLAKAFDREINMIGSRKLSQLAVPSGKSEQRGTTEAASGGLVIQKGNRRFQMTDKGFEEIEPLDTASAYYKELIRSYPDGIANISPEDVVTNGKAETYEVLPLQAGLAQLMQAGALSKLSDGALSIDKPIARFPAGLAGGHSVRFVLRRGVPMPAGNPGHSSVFVEETAECVGHRC